MEKVYGWCRRDYIHSFDSPQEKFVYLEEILFQYRKVSDMLINGKAKNVKYDVEIRTADRRKLYFNGAEGRSGEKFCGSKEVIPFTSFVQDLVCMRALLEVHDSDVPDAYEFDAYLTKYVQDLDRKGLLPADEVNVFSKNKEKSISFVENIQRLFFEVWAPKIRHNTGEYDPDRIVEFFDMQLFL